MSDTNYRLRLERGEMSERLVPAIDIAPFEDGSAAQKLAIAGQVDAACQSIGFLVITGHGISRQHFDDAFAAGRAFFDLPDTEKRRAISPGGLEFLGYTAPLTRNLAATLGDERPPDLREIFTVGAGARFASDFADLPGAGDLYAPNRWPGRPDGFEAVHLRLYRAMEILSERIMRIFAVCWVCPRTTSRIRSTATSARSALSTIQRWRPRPTPDNCAAGLTRISVA